MARSRLQLHDELTAIEGVVKAYYQPDETVNLLYPCVIYKKTGRSAQFANNSVYKKLYEYKITVVDRDPDSLIPERIEDFQFCTVDRPFTSNNLYHNNFTLYY